MAYMNQEKKKIIKEELKKVVPENWKFSLSVLHQSKIVFKLKSADVDILQNIAENIDSENHYSLDKGYFDINPYYLDRQFSGEVLENMEKIKKALYVINHDNSDIMTDYFDVGYYVDMCIGDYDKPFVFTPPVESSKKRKMRI